MSDYIVFIDEGNEFIKTVEFADEIQKTDNYYVIMTRESLPALPYSVEEIYGIRTSGKYGTLKQSYHEFYRIYGADSFEDDVNPEIVITEESNSGYQFFHQVCLERNLDCESMNGKSNVLHYLNMHKNKKILVIADGAAFGSEIDRVTQLIKGNYCNGVQREHNKKLNNGLPILHKVPPKRDYGRYFCIMAEKGGTSHGGLTEKLSLFFHAKKQEVNAYGR